MRHQSLHQIGFYEPYGGKMPKVTGFIPHDVPAQHSRSRHLQMAPMLWTSTRRRTRGRNASPVSHRHDRLRTRRSASDSLPITLFTERWWISLLFHGKQSNRNGANGWRATSHPKWFEIPFNFWWIFQSLLWWPCWRQKMEVSSAKTLRPLRSIFLQPI